LFYHIGKTMARSKQTNRPTTPARTKTTNPAAKKAKSPGGYFKVNLKVKIPIAKKKEKKTAS
jgi:hypothetical protein